MYERHQTLGVRFLVAQDALSIYVNAANPVRDLGQEQLRGLFAGTITDWSEVGGEPGAGAGDREAAELGHPPVLPRPRAGGRALCDFRDNRADDPRRSWRRSPPTRGPSATAARPIASTGSCRRPWTVSRRPPRTSVADRYPLTRYLVFYTAEPPIGRARDFIDWCLGGEGQRVVADVGYVPLWSRGR